MKKKSFAGDTRCGHSGSGVLTSLWGYEFAFESAHRYSSGFLVQLSRVVLPTIPHSKTQCWCDPLGGVEEVPPPPSQAEDTSSSYITHQ